MLFSVYHIFIKICIDSLLRNKKQEAKFLLCAWPPVAPFRVSWLKFETEVSNFASCFLYVMNVFLLIVFINVIKVSSTNFFICVVASSPWRVSWLKIKPWSRFSPVMEAITGFYYFHHKKILLLAFYM